MLASASSCKSFPFPHNFNFLLVGFGVASHNRQLRPGEQFLHHPVQFGCGQGHGFGWLGFGAIQRNRQLGPDSTWEGRNGKPSTGRSLEEPLHVLEELRDDRRCVFRQDHARNRNFNCWSLTAIF